MVAEARTAAQDEKMVALAEQRRALWKEFEGKLQALHMAWSDEHTTALKCAAEAAEKQLVGALASAREAADAAQITAVRQPLEAFLGTMSLYLVRPAQQAGVAF